MEAEEVIILCEDDSFLLKSQLQVINVRSTPHPGLWHCQNVNTSPTQRSHHSAGNMFIRVEPDGPCHNKVMLLVA